MQQEPYEIVLFLVFALVVNVAIYMALRSALLAVPAEHRRIGVGQVWLVLVPVVNLYGYFVVLTGIPRSYQSYFMTKGRREFGEKERLLGIAVSIAMVAATLLPGLLKMPVGLATAVLLLIYLSRLSNMKRLLILAQKQAAAISSTMPAVPIPRPGGLAPKPAVRKANTGTVS